MAPLVFFSGMMFALVLVFSSLSSAEMYKYVDEDGVIHLTNVPDSKCKLVLREEWVPLSQDSSFDRYDPLIRKATERHSVDYALVKAVIKAESNFNPLATSRTGAQGLMQLMPGLAKALQVNDPFHPEDNIEGGVRHLRYLLDSFKGNLHLALAAYNAGQDAVLRHNGVPPYQETQTFVQRVLQYFLNYGGELENPDPS